jgi:hypothetical protein
MLVLASGAVILVSGIYVLHDEKAIQRRNREVPAPIAISSRS